MTTICELFSLMTINTLESLQAVIMPSERQSNQTLRNSILSPTHFLCENQTLFSSKVPTLAKYDTYSSTLYTHKIDEIQW